MQQIQRVYLSPKLWYLRVSIIEAQDILPGHRGLEVVRFPEFSTKVQVVNEIWRTANAAPSDTRSFSNPYWNEEYVFVVTEPFEEYLLVSVEDGVGPGKEEVVARMLLPMATIEKRTDEGPITLRWFNLDSHFGSAGDNHKLITRVVSRIHMRISFDERYDVLDEGTLHSSDYVGVLEMRILGATGLTPMKIKDGRGVTDAYCVAKYGQKWVRTHTVVDSLSPKWDEQYTWEVYDPCSVLTIGVFDDRGINENSNTNNNTITRDYPIGKVRIPLSTIETDRGYTQSHYLLMLHSTGVKFKGELQLAVRFSCTNVANMLLKYTMPLLPNINYTHPLSVVQLDRLRCEALKVVASKLSTEEPPLNRHVVEYIHDSHMWSMRRSKVNLHRLSIFLSMLTSLEAICNWKDPVTSAVCLNLFGVLVMSPGKILPTILLHLAVFVLYNYRYRPRRPPYMDPGLSNAESVLADFLCLAPTSELSDDELDEEFDTFPSTASDDIVRMRYDRLRIAAGRLQTVMGEVAVIAEWFQGLLTWKDPRATFLFVLLCLVAFVGFYVVPIRFVMALLGLYSMGPPRLRSKLPSLVAWFFKRLPSKVDEILVASEGKDYVCQHTQGLLVVSILENLQQRM